MVNIFLESELRLCLLFLNNKVIYNNSLCFQEYLQFKEMLLEKQILNLKKQIFTDDISQTMWLSGRDFGEIFDKGVPQNVIKEIKALCISE